MPDIPHNNCAAECSSTDGCMSYVIDPSLNSGCWFKSKLENGRLNVQNRMVYVDSTKIPRFFSFENRDFPHNDLQYYHDMPHDQCVKTCDADNSCVAVTFDTSRKNGCWTKSAVGNYLSSDNRTTKIKSSYYGL